jgi:hypothetical protein
VKSDEATVYFYDPETGDALYIGKATSMKITTYDEDERKQRATYKYSLSCVTSDGVSTNVENYLYDFKGVVYLMFGKDHWLAGEIDRLTRIKNKTKSKRIKKKLEKRMFTEIFKEWKRSCKSTHH